MFLRGGSREKITTLGLRRAHWNWAQENWWIFKDYILQAIFRDHILQAQEQSISMSRSLPKDARKPARVDEELLSELKHVKEVS